MFLSLLIVMGAGPIAVHRDGHGIQLDNGLVQLQIDTDKGVYAVKWQEKAGLPSVSGAFKNSDGVLADTTSYERHFVGPGDVQRIKDQFGEGLRVVFHHQGPKMPELQQTFWIYKTRPEILVQLQVTYEGEGKSNYLVPIQTQASPQISHRSELRALFVPWDNDNYFRYRSDGWGEGDGDGDGSYEVGATFDNDSRNALVIGSIDHDRWKSAIRFFRNDRKELTAIRAVAGVTSKYTHDAIPHGFVSGHTISSPRFSIGRYSDWRVGMEKYGDLNALVHPPLPWRGGKPFFWNSWSGHKEKVQYKDALGATNFIHNRLPGFRSGGTAFVNLDAGGGNFSSAEMKKFIDHAHALGLRAGTYWTPFVGWYDLNKRVGTGPETYRELVLKDFTGNPLPKLDGGYPLDPTHPLVLAMIDENAKALATQGFDYVKMDFLSHGALEGRHYDRNVTTGTAAYALAMKRIADDLSPARIGRPFFLSESIAPLFPQGYAHSRRVSCDVFANIGASEYLMNSANYAWWEAGRVFDFNDPDSATVYQTAGDSATTEAEAATRFISSVVAGGMMILGDDLSNPPAQERVLKLFGNNEALKIAREHSPFMPVEGDTDYAAGKLFERVDGKTVYFAALNYDKVKSSHEVVKLERLGLKDGTWVVSDVLSGRRWDVETELSLDLPPMSSVLLKLQRQK